MKRWRKRGIYMKCELGNEKLHQMNKLKKMPKKEKDWIEKDAQKGKDWNEKVENGLPIH